jgi:dephospho-CoA kinase
VGGIGAGKSTTARAFETLGCAVVDADALAHTVLREPATVDAVVARWGRAILDDRGQIARDRLARQVFAHPADLAALNALIHPAVLREAEQQIAEYRKNPRVAAIVLDMPLLMEVGWDQRCDRIVFVQCDRKIRAAHQIKKSGAESADLDQREKVQISLDRKQARADNVIINNSDFATLVKQVTEIFTDMIK